MNGNSFLHIYLLFFMAWIFYGYLSKFSNSVANFRPLVPQGLKVSTPIETKWYVVSGEFIVFFLFVLFLQFSSFALLIDVERYKYTVHTLNSEFIHFVICSSKLIKRSGNCTWILPLFTIWLFWFGDLVNHIWWWYLY